MSKGSFQVKESLDELAEDEEQALQKSHGAESSSEKLNTVDAFVSV